MSQVDKEEFGESTNITESTTDGVRQNECPTCCDHLTMQNIKVLKEIDR